MAEMTTYVVSYEWGAPRPLVQLCEQGSPPRCLSRSQANEWIEHPSTMLFSLGRRSLGKQLNKGRCVDKTLGKGPRVGKTLGKGRSLGKKRDK
jgi:hypothetical protein